MSSGTFAHVSNSPDESSERLEMTAISEQDEGATGGRFGGLGGLGLGDIDGGSGGGDTGGLCAG
jgi:hypothetical protein